MKYYRYLTGVRSKQFAGICATIHLFYAAKGTRFPSYALIATDFDVSSFFSAAAFSACATAFSAWLFFSSISLTFRSNSAALPPADLLNLTLLCGLAAPMEPVSGVGTLTIGPVAARPRWNVEGSMRPSGCWKGQVARVQAAPKRQGWIFWWSEGRGGWEKVQPGRVQAAPYRQGIGAWDAAGGGTKVDGFSCSAIP